MLEFSFTGRPDVQKIKDFAASKNGQVLVGFPGGRMHIDATHTEELDANGEPQRDKNGNLITRGGNAAGMETAALAKKLHYGDGSIPARPFLDDAIAKSADELRDAMKQEAAKEKPNWHKIGAMALGKVQEFVRGDYYRTNVPNAPETIDQKGSDTPLIDGGDLLNSLAFIVEDDT